MTAARQPGADVGTLRVACAAGGCGACETRVFEGEPDHRDDVLSADERACGEAMMICVSRGRTPRPVLDLCSWTSDRRLPRAGKGHDG